jgi:hypothetical protein
VMNQEEEDTINCGTKKCGYLERRRPEGDNI